MADMIDELFYGNLDFSMLDFKKDSEYNKRQSRILSLLGEIEDGGFKLQADCLGDALSDLDSVISHAYFTTGFRCGARMALAIMSDDPNTFLLK